MGVMAIPLTQAGSTHPITSNFVGPNQLAIEAKVHPLRNNAAARLHGSVIIVCGGVDAIRSGGGCIAGIGEVGPGGGGPVQAIPPLVWVIYRHRRGGNRDTSAPIGSL